MSKKIQSILLELDPELLKQAQGILSIYADNWKFTTNEFDSILRSEETYAKSIAPKLEKAGFWLTPSMPLTLWQKLKGLNMKVTNARQIEKLFIETFEKNNWKLLSEIVSNWFENKIFIQRSQIIIDALDAHKVEKYTLSIPAILPQVEGILSSATGKLAGKLVTLLKDALPNKEEEFLDNISERMLLRLITSPYMFQNPGSNFSPDKFVKWLTKRGISGENMLNRDAILHGVQINYASKANSLRAFLLLDTLHSLPMISNK